jgi:exonuclease SbcC
MEPSISFPRGSEWRKWDLHVHTPACPLTHSFGYNWQSYVERLIEAATSHGIVAIATADYFTIEGYKTLLNYYDADTHIISHNGKSAPIYLIPGTELRLNNFNSENESINLHVFFDPDSCSPGFIESNFLEKLKVSYRGGEYDLKRQNILAIGKSIADDTKIDIGQDFSKINSDQESVYTKKALSTVTLNKKDIHEALEAIDNVFKNQNLPLKSFLIAVVGKGYGSIRNLKWFEDNKEFSRAGLLREDITHQADIIFSNSLSDRDFYLGKDNKTSASEIETRFKHLKPCVWGSDAKEADKLLHPSCGETFDYTWIKADVSFEGLKQIIYEPDLRVRVQKDNPNEEETFAKIEKLVADFPLGMKIRDKESDEALPFCIQGKQDIFFSSNLSCLIGGRGSGKSTLLHILYNLISDRDTERLMEVNSPLFNLQLGTKDALTKVRLLTKSDIPPATEFFLQNEVEKFAKDIAGMSGLIRARLYGLSASDDTRKGLEQLEVEWKEASDRIDELVIAYDKIVQIDKEIDSIEKQKSTLKKQTDVIKSEDYMKLQQSIEELANHISGFNGFEKECSQIIHEITKLIKSVKGLDWQKYGGQTVLDGLAIELENKREEINGVLKEAKKTFYVMDYGKQLNDKKSELKNFLREKGLSSENIGEVATATQQIANLDEKIRTLKRERVPYQENYDQREELLGSYEAAYSSHKQEVEEVIKRLQENLDVIRTDDKTTDNISFILKLNNQLLKQAIADFIKENNASRTVLRADDIQSVLFGDDDSQLINMVSDKSKIMDAINSSKVANIHTQILQDLVSNPVFVERLYLRMQKYHFDIQNIQVQTKLGEKLLQNTSFGERCGIVIAIVLVAGTNPIVIDQPEDNLDGKYISKVLVPLIRGQKQKRQIILVTRDANIAIGGDSELILMLDKEGPDTKLLPATIENKSMRPNYVWILDGGRRAFQKREEKYSFAKS